jgi:hypothetical protein
MPFWRRSPGTFPRQVLISKQTPFGAVAVGTRKVSVTAGVSHSMLMSASAFKLCKHTYTGRLEASISAGYRSPFSLRGSEFLTFSDCQQNYGGIIDTRQHSVLNESS